jgi:hypothetical protein
MGVREEFKIEYSGLLRHCEVRSNPVNMRNFFLSFWIASSFAMTGTRHEQLVHYLCCILLTIPLRHRLYRISAEYMYYIIPILLLAILIHITSDHLSFPVFYKVVIDDHTGICDLSYKNIEHPQSMLITHMIVLIITFP